MYSPATAKKWLYDLFPWRRLAGRFRAPLFRFEENVLYKDPLSQISASPAPVVQEIYEGQVLDGLDYSILPDPHELAEQQFDGGQGVQSSGILNLPPRGLAAPILEEVSRPLEKPDALEINTAINEASGCLPQQPSQGMEPGLEGVLGDPLAPANPMEMGLEQRLDDPLFNPLFDPLKPLGPGF